MDDQVVTVHFVYFYGRTDFFRVFFFWFLFFGFIVRISVDSLVDYCYYLFLPIVGVFSVEFWTFESIRVASAYFVCFCGRADSILFGFIVLFGRVLQNDVCHVLEWKCCCIFDTWSKLGF